MRSSGSTHNPPRKVAPRLLIVLAGEDHPKACTGRRLLRWGRVRAVRGEGASSPPPIVLDPYSPIPLSAADRDFADRGGILVVDCSWNRLSSRGAFPGSARGRAGPTRHRRLPVLVATNPQHYGRVAQLNSAEAFCAALYILGRLPEAESVIAGFSGGSEFVSVNRARLERYRRSTSPDEVVAAEKALFGRNEKLSLTRSQAPIPR